jgi:hypothetical protein
MGRIPHPVLRQATARLRVGDHELHPFLRDTRGRASTYLPTRANGQLALGVSLRDPRAGGYFPICLDVLAIEGERISEVIAFRSPGSFARFDLPEELPLEGPSA